MGADRTSVDRALRWACDRNVAEHAHHGPLGHTACRKRRDAAEVVEGEWDLTRVLFNEFPDVDHARGFVTDPEFLKGGAVRERAGEYNIVILQGLPRSDSDAKGGDQ